MCIMCACVSLCDAHIWMCRCTSTHAHMCRSQSKRSWSPPTTLHVTFRSRVSWWTQRLASLTSQFAQRILWPCFLSTGITGDYHACMAFTKKGSGVGSRMPHHWSLPLCTSPVNSLLLLSLTLSSCPKPTSSERLGTKQQMKVMLMLLTVLCQPVPVHFQPGL